MQKYQVVTQISNEKFDTFEEASKEAKSLLALGYIVKVFLIETDLFKTTRTLFMRMVPGSNVC